MRKWIVGAISAVIITAAGWYVTTVLLPPLVEKPEPVIIEFLVASEPSTSRAAHRKATYTVYNNGSGLAEDCTVVWRISALSLERSSPMFGVPAKDKSNGSIETNLTSAGTWNSDALVKCKNNVISPPFDGSVTVLQEELNAGPAIPAARLPPIATFKARIVRPGNP
jgi:hypothetical protein